MSKTFKCAALLLAIVLSATACGNPDAEHRTALEGEMPNDLAFVDETNVTCMGDQIMAAYDRIALESKGLDAESLTSGTADVQELFGDRDSELAKNALSCVDADQAFSDALNDHADVRTIAGCLDEEVLAEPDQLGVVLYGDEIKANDDLRTVVRDCMAEEDFATLFGLANPDELAAALTVDPFDRGPEAEPVVSDDVAECLGTTLISEFGVEALDDAGINLDQPELFHRSADFSDEQGEAIVEVLESCDATTPLLVAEMSVEEPEAAACAVDALSAEDQGDLLVLAAAGSRRPIFWRTSLDDCVEKMIEERYGPLGDDVSAQDRLFAGQFSYGFFAGLFEGATYELNTWETECSNRKALDAIAGLPLDVSEAEMEQYMVSNPEFVVKAFGMIECLSPERFLTTSLISSGVRASSAECVIDSLSDDDLRSAMDFAAAFDPNASAQRVDDYLDASRKFDYALTDCASAAEVDAYYGLGEDLDA